MPLDVDGGRSGEGGIVVGNLCAADNCVCVPNAGSCSAGKAKACRADGSGYDEFECDPVQGMTCQADGCKGKCAPPEMGPSYIGCDYYPTVTLNPVWSGFDFAVAVGNASDADAQVSVTRGPTSIASKTIEKRGIQVIKLPWVPELKGGDVDACQTPPAPGATRVVAAGAYRLRSNVPVTVYQFSPLTYEIAPPPAACPVGTQCPGGLEPACKSYSNDASLLLPVNALTGNYAGLAWPSTPTRAGFLAITATEDGTDVEVIGRGAFAPGAGIDPSGKGAVKLARGDVLELVAAHDGLPKTYGADPSGTTVRASRPVQVIGGHSCANIPAATTGYCDHLEQQLFPVEVIGKDYVVTFPAAIASASPHVIRVVAAFPDTTVTFDPPLLPPSHLGPGDAPLQIDGVTEDVHVISDKGVLVAQYMQGSTSVPSGAGDPSMALVVPTAQYRREYTFVASSTYDSNYVNVVAPAGTEITIDGEIVPVAEFTALPRTTYAVARRELGRSDVHRASGDAAFGVVVYGYGKDTSYMYPGGLDLKRISEPPVR